MAQSVLILKPDEILIKEDFADVLLQTPTPSSDVPIINRKFGRLYLTNQRLVHAFWPRHRRWISRSIDLFFLSRFVAPTIIDVPLNNIAAFMVGKGLFESKAQTDHVLVEFGPNASRITSTLPDHPGKKFPTQYLAIIKWSVWSPAVELALAAQNLRLTKEDKPASEPKIPDAKTGAPDFKDIFADFFTTFRKTRWLVEKK